MTEKEYSEIMEDIRKHTFPHTYQSLDEVEPHEEDITVIAYEDVINIFHGYIKRKKKKRRKRMSKELEQARELVRMLEEKERHEKGKVKLCTLKHGEEFKIGEYDFIVLHQKESGTLVISKDLMAENERFGDNRDYKESITLCST